MYVNLLHESNTNLVANKNWNKSFLLNPLDVAGGEGEEKDLKQIFFGWVVELMCVSVRGFPDSETLLSCWGRKLNFHVYTGIGFSDLHQGKVVRGVVSLISSEISLFVDYMEVILNYTSYYSIFCFVLPVHVT